MPIHETLLEKLRQNDPGLTRLELSRQNLKAEDIHILLQALVSNSALNELDLTFNYIGDEGAKALAENQTLTRLNLSWNKIGAEGAKALAENSTLAHLNLRSNEVGDEGAKALAENKALTQLDLSNNQIGVEGAKALAENKALAHLNLRSNEIGDEGAKALMKSNTLTVLNLSANRIGAEGVKALAENKTLIQLDLSGNQIGAEGAKALVGNRKITWLSLNGNRLGDEGAKALAASNTLIQLDLRSNQIGAEGAKALADNSTLTWLNLNVNKIGDKGAKALAANKTLIQLDLNDNQIGDEGTKALAGNNTLTWLNLENNKIGNEGAKALAENNTLAQLNLERNQIGDEGAKALAENKALTQLNLRINLIGKKGAEALAGNKTLAQLDLSYNEIGSEGAKALARNRALTQLNLSVNQIDDEGAKALAGNKTLTRLDLSTNQITDGGAKALAASNTLTQLNLSHNQIGDEGAKAFLNNFTLMELNILDNPMSASRQAQVEAHIRTNGSLVIKLSTTVISYIEKGAPVMLAEGIRLIGNEKGAMTGATIAITSNFLPNEDKLHFKNQEGITGSYDSATGVLTLSGVSSLSAYQSALRSIGYENTSENPSTATRAITLALRGGGGRTHSVSCSLGVIAVNDPPRVVNPIPPFELLVNELGNYTLPVGTFEDPEGEELRLWAKTVTNGSLPAWIQFDSAAQTFSIFSPAAGRYPVRVLASDPSNATVFNDFWVKVKSRSDTGGGEALSSSGLLIRTIVLGLGVAGFLFYRFRKAAKPEVNHALAAQLRGLLNLGGVDNFNSVPGRAFVGAVEAWLGALWSKGIDLKGLEAGERQAYLLEVKSLLQARGVVKKSWFGKWTFDTALFHKLLPEIVEALIKRVPGEVSTEQKAAVGDVLSQAEPGEVEGFNSTWVASELPPTSQEEEVEAPGVGITSSHSIGFFPSLAEEEQAEEMRIFSLAAEFQNVITKCLSVIVTINRGKYLEIQEQEEEALDDLSQEALRSTLAQLFGDNLYEVSTGYRIDWSALSAGQSEAFASLYEAEYQCLLEASATKTSTFSEAETLKTSSFVDALDNDPSNKVKIAVALQSLIEEKLAINVGRKKGVSMSVQGLSEVLPEEKIKAQALIDSLKVLTIGSGASFSEDSITLPWESLRAEYIKAFNETFENQLMRLHLESSVTRSFTP